jgi:hypothetical protein
MGGRAKAQGRRKKTVRTSSQRRRVHVLHARPLSTSSPCRPRFPLRLRTHQTVRVPRVGPAWTSESSTTKGRKTVRASARSRYGHNLYTRLILAFFYGVPLSKRSALASPLRQTAPFATKVRPNVDIWASPGSVWIPNARCSSPVRRPK